MIVFDVWNGTPATSGGMTGREPAAMTIRSAVICSPVDSRSLPGPANSACASYSAVLGPCARYCLPSTEIGSMRP